MPCPKVEVYSTKNPKELTLKVSDSHESILTVQFYETDRNWLPNTSSAKRAPFAVNGS